MTIYVQFVSLAPVALVYIVELEAFNLWDRMQVPEAIPGGIEYEVIRKILNLENRLQVPAPLPSPIAQE